MTLHDAPAVFRSLRLDALAVGEVVDGVSGGAHGPSLKKISPATGAVLGTVRMASVDDVQRVTARSADAFLQLRALPGPRRGELARAIGEAFRAHKPALGALIALETGKIRSEGEGEVQEIVDIADYAVGLSRTIGGRTLMSERTQHRLTEQWHALGPVAVISAFNFPAAVWSWNALIALVCGDSVVWKPSQKAPLTAVAVHSIIDGVLAQFGVPHAMQLCLGTDDVVGKVMVQDQRYALVSATGSTRMGRAVQAGVHARFGRCLLELGGNNAVVVMPDADLRLATRAIVFGAVGTTGQRCTTTRRVLVHKDAHTALLVRLQRAYAQVKVGHPLDHDTLMGPLIDDDAIDGLQRALVLVPEQGGTLVCGGERIARPGSYVTPALASSHIRMPMLQHEVFAPLLHVMPVASLDEAITVNNDVPQGLSSSIFTNDMRAAERFLSAAGSDCGIANVNTGTSGAEIGGAFGGEKETGGGREAGSDSWKAYMRRQTNTVNYGDDVPLAQGIVFDV